MSYFKGTLVAAGMFAAAGLGCSHYRAAHSKTTQSTTQSTMTPAPAPMPSAEPAPQPGANSTALPGSPAIPTTPDNVPMQPGVGGSGVDVKNGNDLNPDNCDRNQIGSPNSPDVNCNHQKIPDSSVNGTGSGMVGQSGSSTSDMGIGGSGSSDFKSDSSLPADQSDKSLNQDKSLNLKDKDQADLKGQADLNKSSGIGGSGEDQTITTTETKKTVKHKKHAKRKTQDTSGTGGSGLVSDPSKDKTHDSTSTLPNDQSSSDTTKSSDQSDMNKDKLP